MNSSYYMNILSKPIPLLLSHALCSLPPFTSALSGILLKFLASSLNNLFFRMPSVMVRNVLFANLFQGALSTPRSSAREELLMPHPILSRPPTGIHSLPVELLTRIFVLGCASHYPYEGSPFLLKLEQEYADVPSSDFQVVASHVCHHWRQVALRTPSLWTTLHFRETSHIPRAEAYLARCSKSSTYVLDILVDTIAVEDHTPGVTLYKDEVRTIFEIITPHVKHWRAFHLKICDNDCKGLARMFLSNCGPAPKLETLQLYHFEDYRTSQNLYQATYRRPVIVFSNNLPRLTNVSLIGVNLPWEESPYLTNLRNLELALHPDKIRPEYHWWDRMLRLSPELETLCLHYSGPKEATGEPSLAWPSHDDKIQLPRLQELSFTDLDPDYLCNLLERLHLPNLKKLTLDLPEQNFSPFIDLLTSPVNDVQAVNQSNNSGSLNFHIPSIAKLCSLTVRALECSQSSWSRLLRSAQGLRTLEVDFTRVGVRFWKAFNGDGNFGSTSDATSLPLLPLLNVFKLSGLSGQRILAILLYMYRHPTGDQLGATTVKWIIGWSEAKRGRDVVLDTLVDRGYWTPGHGDLKITIESFDDSDDDDVEGEVEVDGAVDVLGSSDEEGTDDNLNGP